MSEDLGHWVLAEGLDYSPNRYGFIYLIVNKLTGKKYIGKKQCVSKVRRKPLKGQKRVRLGYKESDWKSYTSSSKELNEDITRHGKDNFQFVILDWCDSKWELGYKEIKKQIEENVLLQEGWYNGILNCRLKKPPKSFFEK